MDESKIQAVEREDLRREILDAFNDVSREGGISWGKSQVTFLYELEVNHSRCSGSFPFDDPLGLSEFSFPDHDSKWQELVADPTWDPDDSVQGFSYLDRVGFRYYLPAAMLRALPSVSHPGIACALTLEDDVFKKARLKQWSILNLPQRNCVRRFLRYMHTLQRIEETPFSQDPWITALLSYWILEEQDRETERIRQEILEAFEGVSREGGVSWAGATLLDNYGWAYGDEFHDRDSRWQDLVDDPEWSEFAGSGGFVFVDDIGFRYYLPAAMFRVLKNQDYGHLEFALDPECSLAQWSLLNLKQRHSVRSFVQFMNSLSAYDDSDVGWWSGPWNYWKDCDL